MKWVILLSLGMGVSLGGPPAKARAKVPTVSQAQVEVWLKSWQRRLALDDWDIGAQIVRSSDLRPDTLGNLKWNSATKKATVRVLNPLDYDLPAKEIPIDIEYTVVHELIHLQLAALPRDPANKNVEEKVVNRISEALFALDKGASYRPRTEVIRMAIKEKTSSEASRVKQ
jgi:hypothetical protein